MDKNTVFNYTMLQADQSLILGQRMSELCGHNPSVELDLGISNTALDLLGQARLLFQYASKLTDGSRSEDQLAMIRQEHEYRSLLLLEMPNTDFAHTILKQYVYDVYNELHLNALAATTKDSYLRAFANKTLKENAYHRRFSSMWLMRLGDGTEESHNRMQAALDYLIIYFDELVTDTPIEQRAADQGIGVLPSSLKDAFFKQLQADFAEATLNFDSEHSSLYGGKEGRHTEHMGFILTELQYMQRAYPQMAW